MNYGPELLLVGAVITVGVLHTMVPDHWVPITLIARQRGWSKSETASRASGRDWARALDTAHRVSRVAGGGRIRTAFRPYRRHGLEPRTHCLWQLVCHFRMARSAKARRARAQS
jgi:hypothetical protein